MTSSEAGSNAFHQFEHAGWERAAEFYGDAFGVLTSQTATALLDAARVSRGTRLLDVASGPGYVAGEAAARGASVVGLDFAAAMVREAGRRHPGIEFREGNAEALPFEDASFDAVVMNFAMLHLARPDAAIAEARRVLRADGRYAFTVWAPPEKTAAFGVTLRAIEALGDTNIGLPEGPPFFRFSDADGTRLTLERAGFAEVEIQEVPLTWRLNAADAVFEAMSRGGVRTAAVLRGQTPQALAAIRDAMRQGIARYAVDGGVAVPMPAVLASATRLG